MLAEDISDVLRMLDDIIEDTRSRRDPLGYFAALYRQVTLKVRDGIREGFFENGTRMAQFDAAFANRYFAAYQAFQAGGKPSKSWQVAFKSTQAGQIILQDLLVGINAHINLDLGVVTAESFPDSLNSFHGDFDKINQILAALVSGVEAVVGRFSPLIDLLDRVGGRDQNAVLNFSLDAARDDAWRNAVILSLQPPSIRPYTIQALDGKTAFLGKLISQPGGLAARVIGLIRDMESRNVPAIIDALNSIAA
jgi:hypothetical protein